MARKEIGTRTTPNTLLYDIDTTLADNNAGLISARDVRDNMANIAESIPYIVASGDWESVGTQFISNIYLKKTTDVINLTEEGGVLIVESGIQFNNNIAGGELQVHAYPGPTGIRHGDLADLAANDDHPQYLNINGVRNMGANLGIGDDNWINNDGISTSDGHGFRFEKVSTTREVIHVGEDSYLKFDSDDSEIKTGKSTALAWISFNSTPGAGEANTVTVNSSYNISMIERVQEQGVPMAGKFKIYFKPGLFDADTTGVNICALGTSNARQSNAHGGDFDQNTVSCVVRNSDYVTFYVQDDTNAFRDAEINDLMVFGIASGVAPEVDPVVVRYEPIV